MRLELDRKQKNIYKLQMPYNKGPRKILGHRKQEITENGENNM